MGDKDKMDVKVKLNCIGCGLCCSICPDVFELNLGKVKIIENANIEKYKTCIKESAMNCPTESIVTHPVK